MNVRENRRDNQEWTIQRHWQHRAHKTQDKYNETQKHKNATQHRKMSNMDPTKKPGMHPCAREG